MARYSSDDIRNIFSTSSDFNEIFDAFEEAIGQGLKDVELYRQLFWNSALSPDEVCLFGEKLAATFVDLAFDVFMWLASVFEVTYSSYDNFELAIKYYQKAARARPTEVAPFIDASDCYDPDLNIPPLDMLLKFLRTGIPSVENKKALLQRLAYLYELGGDEEMAKYYRRLSDDIGRIKN